MTWKYQVSNIEELQKQYGINYNGIFISKMLWAFKLGIQ